LGAFWVAFLSILLRFQQGTISRVKMPLNLPASSNDEYPVPIFPGQAARVQDEARFISESQQLAPEVRTQSANFLIFS